jgi:hypothetical protein
MKSVTLAIKISSQAIAFSLKQLGRIVKQSSLHFQQ